MKNRVLQFMINSVLMLFGSLMTFSGFLIQFNYHMGHHNETDMNNTVMGFNYFGWSDIHKVCVILISIFMFFHIMLHWKWYKTVIKKKLFAKNKQTITLSLVFIPVVLTGYMAWLIKLTGGQEISRIIFIEIHDKIVIILFIFLILHVSKRYKWFFTTSDKLTHKYSIQEQNAFKEKNCQ